MVVTRKGRRRGLLVVTGEVVVRTGHRKQGSRFGAQTTNMTVLLVLFPLVLLSGRATLCAINNPQLLLSPSS